MPWHFYTGILLASCMKTTKHVQLYSDEHPMLLTPVIIIYLIHQKKHLHKSVNELWVFWKTCIFNMIMKPADFLLTISLTKWIQSTSQHISWKHPVIPSSLLYLTHLASGLVPPISWQKKISVCHSQDKYRDNTTSCVEGGGGVQGKGGGEEVDAITRKGLRKEGREEGRDEERE